MRTIFTLLLLFPLLLSAKELPSTRDTGKDKKKIFKQMKNNLRSDNCDLKLDSIISFNTETGEKEIITLVTTNSEGLTTSLLSYPFDPAANTWSTDLIQEYLYEYDDQGKEIKLTINELDIDGKFTKGSVTTKTYGTNGLVNEELYYGQWDETSSAWLSLGRDTYKYDENNNLIEEIRNFKYMEQDWYVSYKIEYEYNEDGTISKETDYQPGTYELKMCSEKIYIYSKGVLTKSIHTNYNVFNDEYMISNDTYTYCEDGNLIERISVFDQENSNWPSESVSDKWVYLYEYDEQNNLLVEEEQAYLNDIQVNGEKIVYTYNSCGMPETFFMYFWEDDALELWYHEVAYYSDKDMGTVLLPDADAVRINVTADAVTVSAPCPVASIQLYSITGQQLKQSRHTNTLSTAGLRKGIYILSITLSNGSRINAKHLFR